MLPSQQVGNVLLVLHNESYEVHWQDNVLTCIALIMSLLVDAFVLYKELQWDTFWMFAEYLTNQVFLVGMLSKILLVFYMIQFAYNLHQVDNGSVLQVSFRSEYHLFVFACFSLFLGYGACLCGVYGAFFMLSYLDDTLLSNMVCNNSSQSYKIGEVLLWNHIRHVFVLFIHMTLIWSLRGHIVFWYKEHLCTNRQQKFAFVLTTVAIPTIVGITHKFVSNDEALYKYDQTTIGSSVTLMFVLSCCSAWFYYWMVIRY